MNGRSDLESLLSETLRAVGDQTVPDRTYSFESIRRDLVRPIQSTRRLPRFGPRGYWLVAAASIGLLLAGLAVVKAGGGAFTAATGGGRHDLVSSDGRLYLLPAGDTDLRLGVFSATNIIPDEGSSIVIGRPTKLGFDHLAIASYHTTFPSASTRKREAAPRDPSDPTALVITPALVCAADPCGPGDPSFLNFDTFNYYANYANNRSVGGTAGGTIPVPDGGVLEVQTGAGLNVADVVNAGTGLRDESPNVSNGQIFFTPPPASSNRDELEVIGRVNDIAHRDVTELIYPNPSHDPNGSLSDSALQILANAADTFTLITQKATGGDAELLYLATLGGATSVERTTVWGTPGYKLLTVPGGPTGLVWHSSTGHVVALISSLGETETLALAEGLRSVDETTWAAELARINGQ